MKRTPPEPHSSSVRRTGKGQMLAATSAFLVLAILLLYGFIHLLGRIARRALTEPMEARTEPALEASSTPVPTGALNSAEPVPPEGDLQTAQPVITMPEASAPQEGLDAQEAAETLGIGRAEAPLPQESLTPTFTQRAKADFSRSRMDMVLLGFDGKGYLDSLALMVLRSESCTFLFLPENLLDASGQPLSRHHTCQGALASLESILPLDLDRYLFFSTDRIGDCVAALGGISVGGVRMTDADAQAYGADRGEDSLIRLSRLQELTRGAVSAIRQVSLFRLGELKEALLSSGGGSCTREEYLSLYLSLRALEDGKIHTRLLPIDSVTLDNVRYYRLDQAQTESVLRDYYRFS
ncbi:MAG: hypothetical protein IJF41_01240 [Clostridia bacterium]|nr:hypothetical protein [Clostridia bacterium]